MRELLRTNDLVHLSWVQAVLAAEGIDCVLLDDHVSGVEGSIGAIPRRLMVPHERLDEARDVLERARDALSRA
jgi:Putative prokaryotic signal transducing protein